MWTLARATEENGLMNLGEEALGGVHFYHDHVSSPCFASDSAGGETAQPGGQRRRACCEAL